MNFTTQLRALLPNHPGLINIDDGFGDASMGAQVAWRLETVGLRMPWQTDQRMSLV